LLIEPRVAGTGFKQQSKISNQQLPLEREKGDLWLEIAFLQ
jgi:hypothetical protein